METGNSDGVGYRHEADVLIARLNAVVEDFNDFSPEERRFIRDIDSGRDVKADEVDRLEGIYVKYRTP